MLNSVELSENLCPDYIKNSWVYYYFPDTYKIDKSRFLTVHEIYELFKENGFTLDIKITTLVQPLNYAFAIKEVKNRDMSQLNLISEEKYLKGLQKLESDYDSGNNFFCDFSLIECRGIKINEI